MFAKAVVHDTPGGRTLPLMFAVDSDRIWAPRLHRLGWTTYGERLHRDQRVSLHITPDGVSLRLHSHLIIGDADNPNSPPGWWRAVDSLNQWVALVLLDDGESDDARDISVPPASLWRSPRTAQGLIRLTHQPVETQGRSVTG